MAEEFDEQTGRALATRLQGRKVAILVDEGFEEVEMTEPRRALEEAGAGTDLVSPQRGVVRAWNGDVWGKDYQVDVQLGEAIPADYDALLLPGGVMNPDKLRLHPEAIRFIRSFFEDGKPIAAICHGPWTLIDAGAVRGRRVTSWPSLKSDLRNAGAEWVDERVVVADGLVTSRKPDDIPAFNKAMIDEFARPARVGRASESAR